ncbi:hypothetical protein G6L37_05455 [Agrobacterium rubi]|nr:hypothetical protein [Agrobacterium rubi]NTF24804.1 hypothetical protein [Agrobacterium rubi]
MNEPNIEYRTVEESIAPYRRWIDLIVASIHLVCVALAGLAIYAAFVLAPTPSAIVKFTVALALLTAIGVKWYLMSIKRRSGTALLFALFYGVTAYQCFSDGGIIDYGLTFLTAYHLVIYFPLLVVDPEFQKFTDDHRREEALAGSAR